jgi:hypothetical protein
LAAGTRSGCGKTDVWEVKVSFDIGHQSRERDGRGEGELLSTSLMNIILKNLIDID